jgi:hypothetical protein
MEKLNKNIQVEPINVRCADGVMLKGVLLIPDKSRAVIQFKKKVYASGIPDEIVKDVFIIGTPLTVLQSVVATSDAYKIFRGMCGAESGSVPVSAVSPSILVSLVETQAKQNIQLKKFITKPSDELGEEN